MIADLADRIRVLDYGRTIADGKPDTALSDPMLWSHIWEPRQCKADRLARAPICSPIRKKYAAQYKMGFSHSL